MKDLMLAPRDTTSTNYGPGELDFIQQEGHLLEVEDNDMIAQAVLKMTISPQNPNNGYGIAIKEFRGSKQIVPFRLAFNMRLLRGINLLQKWYNKEIKVQNVSVFQNPTEGSFVVEMTVNDLKVTAGG